MKSIGIFVVALLVALAIDVALVLLFTSSVMLLWNAFLVLAIFGVGCALRVF